MLSCGENLGASPVMMGSELVLGSLLIFRAAAGNSESSSGCFRLRTVLSDTTTGTSDEGSSLMVTLPTLAIPGGRGGSSSAPSLSFRVSSSNCCSNRVAAAGASSPVGILTSPMYGAERVAGSVSGAVIRPRAAVPDGWSPDGPARAARGLALLVTGRGSSALSLRSSFFSSFWILASSECAYFVQLSRDSRYCLALCCLSSSRSCKAACRMESFVYSFSQSSFSRVLDKPIWALVDLPASGGLGAGGASSAGEELGALAGMAACSFRSSSSSRTRARFCCSNCSTLAAVALN